jgi:energy-coupling factor transporter ATP-binding protein EcfA2
LAASIVVNFPDVGTLVAAYGLVMGVHELQPAVVPGSTAVGAPLIHLEDVARRYRVGEREVVALADVSFDVYAEEFVVVLGPSGSGKTTLGDLLERVVDVQAPTWGARSTRRVSSRRARRDATASSASAPSMATSAMVSTPRWRSTMTVRATSTVSSAVIRIATGSSAG